MPGVEFPGEISTRRLQDLISAAELTVFPLQLRDAILVPGRGAGPLPGIDLHLIHPVAKRLGVDAEPMANPGDRPTRVPCLRPQLEDHLHCPFPQLSGMRLPGYHEPQLSQRSQPPRNPGQSSLSCAINLANCLTDLEDLAQAEALERQTISELCKKLGTRHPDTLACEANLAITLRHAGRHTEAEQARTQTLEKLSQTLDPQHPDVQLLHDWWHINRDLEQFHI
jgi:hypothetical protein